MADMKLTNMRRTAAERKDDGGERAPEGDDVHVRLEHHHIEKLGLSHPLPHGTSVKFHGEGEVADSGTHEGYDDAEPRHHMTIRLKRAGIQHDADGDDDGDLRTELKRNTEAHEKTRDGGKVQIAALTRMAAGADKGKVRK